MRVLADMFELHYAYNYDDKILIVAIGDIPTPAVYRPHLIWLYQRTAG